jgi:hypothetical protein
MASGSGATVAPAGEAPAPLKYYNQPFEFREPKDESSGPCIYDRDGNQIAMLFWATHSVTETAEAEQETYRLGRAMAKAVNSFLVMLARAGDVSPSVPPLCKNCGKEIRPYVDSSTGYEHLESRLINCNVVEDACAEACGPARRGEVR